jgi:flagellar hook-associated protein 2
MANGRCKTVRKVDQGYLKQALTKEFSNQSKSVGSEKMASVTSASSINTSTGLGQGIDVNQFVQLALAADNARITQFQSQQTNLGAKAKALTQITGDLTALQAAAFALNDPLGTLNGQTATSSNATALSATATSTATPAVHTITVSSLATTSSQYTNALATSSTTLGTGSFQIQVGSGAPATIAVSSTNNTLDGIAAAINNQSVGVLASVITDANGARLSLVSQTTGAPGDVTVSGNTTGLTFTKAVTGSNASLVVDGVPISTTSNVVSGVINGVTLNLTSAAPTTPVTVTVTPDATKATTAVNTFVSAYNTAIKDISAQFQVNPDGSGGGALEADGSLREAQSALLGATSYAISGNNGFVNLSTIGVNLANDGTLSVDQSKLSSALSSNSSNVQSLFQATTTGFAGHLSTVLTSLVDPASGVLGLDTLGIAQTAQSLGQKISDLQAALIVKQQNLNLVYSQVNTTLQSLPLLQSQLAQQLATA